jgi:hypothetical protein
MGRRAIVFADAIDARAHQVRGLDDEVRFRVASRQEEGVGLQAFSVSADTAASRVTELFGVEVTRVEPVLYPVWQFSVVGAGTRRDVLVDATYGRIVEGAFALRRGPSVAKPSAFPAPPRKSNEGIRKDPETVAPQAPARRQVTPSRRSRKRIQRLYEKAHRRFESLYQELVALGRSNPKLRGLGFLDGDVRPVKRRLRKWEEVVTGSYTEILSNPGGREFLTERSASALAEIEALTQRISSASGQAYEQFRASGAIGTAAAVKDELMLPLSVRRTLINIERHVINKLLSGH